MPAENTHSANILSLSFIFLSHPKASLLWVICRLVAINKRILATDSVDQRYHYFLQNTGTNIYIDFIKNLLNFSEFTDHKLTNPERLLPNPENLNY